jgi:hypothetical protein
MIDLRERLQELADAAIREGATPGPAHAIRRGRRWRRRRIAAATASLLVVALAAGALATGRLTAERDLPAVGPPATVPPEPLARIDLHRNLSGAGFAITNMVTDLASTVEPCAGGSRRAELVGYVRSERYRRLVMIVAVPPKPGETAVCWTAEMFELSGAGSFSARAGATAAEIPLTVAGKNSDVYGTVQGQVTRRAARVRVEFTGGRRPLDLPVIDTAGRYPVNFFAAFFAQDPDRPGHPRPWTVARLTAIDAAGRPVATCKVERTPIGQARCAGG